MDIQVTINFTLQEVNESHAQLCNHRLILYIYYIDIISAHF